MNNKTNTKFHMSPAAVCYCTVISLLLSFSHLLQHAGGHVGPILHPWPHRETKISDAMIDCSEGH